MKKTYTVTALVDIEVEAENEKEAISLAYDMGEFDDFQTKSVNCFDDEAIIVQ